jgi:IclR family acetate operon transcriptional repressor
MHTEFDSSSSAQRAFAVLEVIIQADRPVSLTEVVEAVGLPKPTVFRILATLDSGGWVLREPGGKKYTAGRRLADFGLAVMMNNSVRALRRTIVARVARQIGETCNLTFLAGEQVLYVERVETRWPLKVEFSAGTRVPLHCSSSGKLFLSMMTRPRREALLENLVLTRYTDTTITCVAELEVELDRIRACQVSVNNEEYLAGLVGLAVPVLDGGGRITFALAIQAPAARMTTASALEHVPYLREAARALAATLGAQAGHP